MRGKLTVAVATIALVVGVVTLASAHPRGASGKGERVIKVLEVVPPSQATTLDLGPQGLSLGDQLISSGDLFSPKGGPKLGIDGVVCSIVRIEQKGNAVTNQCVATASFAGGQITAQGLVTFSGEAPPSSFDFAVTGGTGDFEGVKGQVTVEPINETDTLLTVHLLNN